ncbi:TPA: hypothetical protein QDB28_005688 [Burkholderia vietnamiensis]|nr:hypothetical protein [Burkholderia vietnamiensis]
MPSYRTKEAELEEEVSLLLEEIQAIKDMRLAEIAAIKAATRREVLREVREQMRTAGGGSEVWGRALHFVDVEITQH